MFELNETLCEISTNWRDNTSRKFQIKFAKSTEELELVNTFLKDRYDYRGYKEVNLSINESSDKFTLVALDDQLIIGTITVSFNLSKDHTFFDYIESFKNQKICEFIKLAVDTSNTSRILPILFHIVHIIAYKIHKCDLLLIEVNPRHVRFYERMLGFIVHSEERVNKFVNAPSLLLSLNLAYAEEQVNLLAGHPELMKSKRSIYPGMLSLCEEDSVISKIL